MCSLKVELSLFLEGPHVALTSIILPLLTVSMAFLVEMGRTQVSHIDSARIAFIFLLLIITVIGMIGLIDMRNLWWRIFFVKLLLTIYFFSPVFIS